MAKTKTRTKAEPKPKSRRRAAENPEQYKRFREAARELGTDESEEAFERAFGQVVHNKPTS